MGEAGKGEVDGRGEGVTSMIHIRSRACYMIWEMCACVCLCAQVGISFSLTVPPRPLQAIAPVVHHR